MGLDYHLECQNCGRASKEVEFSVVGYIQMKSPDEAREKFEDWAAFLVAHSGHEIHFIDSKGKATDPSKITGGYVIGLMEYEP